MFVIPAHCCLPAFVIPVVHHLCICIIVSRNNKKLSRVKETYLHFIVVNIPLSLDHGIEAQSLVYAVIDEIKILDHGSGTNLFYQATGPIIFIDLNQVQCVIGRILDRGKWAIVDRSTSVAQIYHTL